MNRLLLIVRHEVLEHRRQRMMLLAMGTVLVLVALTVLLGVGIMALLATDPEQVQLLEDNLAFAGFELQDPIAWSVELMLRGFDFLVFAQLLGMTAVLAGHSFVHERQCNTLPFLMLAPVRRSELVLGKLLGAVATPWLLTLCIGGSTALLLACFDVTQPFAWRLPPSGGWLVAFLLGGPLWALAVAGCGALVSMRSTDVRTAQQGVWVVVFFATISVGVGLGGALQEDLGFQLVLAAAAVPAILLVVGLGSLLLGRDIHL